MELVLALAAVVGYLLGSVSFAVLVSRARHGADVRTMGSGNAGMTNMLRSFGKGSAIITMVGDTAKGALAVLCGHWLEVLLPAGAEAAEGNAGGALYAATFAGMAVILGHAFPLFFGFKGGKGIAATLGVILALSPVVAVSLLTMFAIVVVASKMVSLGSVIGIALYPVFNVIWVLMVTHTEMIFTTVCAALVAGFIIWLHRANIKRIVARTEYRFGQKRP